MNAVTSQTRSRHGVLPPLERFLREYVDQAGGLWDEVEPQVYDVLLDDEPARLTFDPEALPEHPSAQLASLGSPLIDRLLAHAGRLGAHSVLYAAGLNVLPHDLPGRLRHAFTTAPKALMTTTGIRLCFFPQALYRFVATFVSDQKEQACLEVVLDLHSGREVRHFGRLYEHPLLLERPAEPLPEAPHLSLPSGFVLASRQAARSVGPLANQRRRELAERTGRQIERMERYYARMLDELSQQPRRGPDSANAAARKESRDEAIRRERMLRVSELKQKSVLRISMALSHVLVVHLPKLVVRFELSHPPAPPRACQAVYDPLSESFEPMQARPGAAPTFDLTGPARILGHRAG